MAYTSSAASKNHQLSSRVMTPTIYRLAADRSYAKIPQAVHDRPNDVQWTDRHGSTALHLLCQAKTMTQELVDAVSAILTVFPDAVQFANASTWTPLHFAIQQAGTREAGQYRHHPSTCLSAKFRIELILLLLHACPSAVRVRATSGYRSKTAFHMACETDADYEILRTMLQIDPTLSTASYICPKKHKIRTPYISISTRSLSTTRKDMYETPLQVLWKAGRDPRKMALLLQAAYFGQVSDRVAAQKQHRRKIIGSRKQQSASFILHAACQFECPRDYFLEVLERHGDDCMRKMKGSLPLHILLAQPPTSYSRFCFRHLLQVAPSAAGVVVCVSNDTPTTQQRLPLHLALEHRWPSSCIQELVHCHAHALRVADPFYSPDHHHYLVPFALAAAHDHDLSTIWALLSAAPEMLNAVVRK